MNKINNYTPKEIYWLSFNDRVLQEATDPENPIIERLKFLGIYSNNQDEFFRVRVATLKRLSKMHINFSEILGANPAEILEIIHTRVKNNRGKVENALHLAKQELEANNVFFVNENQIPNEHIGFIKEYFYKQVRPLLMPIILDEKSKIPEIKDDAVYFAVKMKCTSSDRVQYALVKIPSNRISRFVVLPEINGKKYIMLIDDVIR